MSMEVNNSYSGCRADYFEKPRAGEKRGDIKAEETEKKQGAGKAADGMPVLKDEYISSEKSGTKPSGLYRLGQDENGNPKVVFDSRKKNASADGDMWHTDQKSVPEEERDAQHKAKPSSPETEGNARPGIKSGKPEQPEEKYTGNTDKVDREIKKLKERKEQLERQLHAASQDEKKKEELKKELAQVESELSRKDNDTYRRQNTSFHKV